MRSYTDSAPFLLIVTGGLLGLIFPLGKIATQAGVSPVVWSFMISAGVGAILLAWEVAAGRTIAIGRARLAYFFITGLISFAIPNLLIFAVIGHLGAGFTSILFTLSPLITLGFSILLGLRGPNIAGVAGVLIGFSGAIAVALTRGEVGAPASLLHVGLGLLIPVSLAAGNVYRTLAWPKDARALELAAGSHLAAAAMLGVAGFLVQAGFDLGELAQVPLVAAAQVAASAAMFAFFFRLQAAGGPLYLSQIGYVAAAVALVAATVFLGERYSLVTWSGAAVIMVGIVLTSLAQAHQNRQAA